MQKTEHNQTAPSTHRKVQVSTTLNRKYVRKPLYNKMTEQKQGGNQAISDDTVKVSVGRSPKISRFNDAIASEAVIHTNRQQEAQESQELQAPKAHPLQIAANERMKQRTISVVDSSVSTMTAREMKDQAIQKALAQASQPVEPTASSISSKLAKTTKKSQSKKSHSRDFGKVKFGFGRVMLALSCTAVVVFAIVYFVNLNMPDLSLKVAAMQTGIQASYPNYVPRDFALSDITSEDGRVVLNFKNSSTGDAYTIVEERSSWDSNALLTNYVVDAYGEDYTVLREQGLTIYVDGSNATWVNGGVLFKLTTTSGSLSKKQIVSIATSL